jgi:hypothetical protein
MSHLEAHPGSPSEQQMRPGATWDTDERTGWRVFAGTMLFIGGLLNVLSGLVTVFRTNYLTSLDSPHTIVLPVTNHLHTWGWADFVIGLVMAVTGLSLYFRASTWNRVTGMVIAGLNMLFQLAFMAAFPFWSFTMIVVDILVIYGLAIARPQR